LPAADVRDAVRAAVAAREADLLKVAEALIRVDSTNPRYPGAGEAAVGGEARAGDVLGERCAAIGLEVERTGPDPGRQNLVAIARGAACGRSLLLNGHLDTVPPADPAAWTLADPREPERRDGLLLGLGAADMKGPIAAAWAALAGLHDARVRPGGDVQLHAVVGEEAMEHEFGTTAVLRAGFTADAAVNLEPTSTATATLALTTASPGYRSVTIRVRGRSTHHGNRPLVLRPGGGGDAVGVNALEKGVEIVRALRALERRWAVEKHHPCFAPGSFTLHPGTFRSVGAPGLPAPVYFPADAELEYAIWYPPGQSGAEVEAEVESFVGDWCRVDPWLRDHPPTFEWAYDWPPFETAWDEPVVATVAAALEAVTGTPVRPPSPSSPAAVGASVDSTWIRAAGIPVVTFGPGEMRVAHSPDEHVAIAELVTAAQVLALAIVDWCGAA
jgi:acetylornithine deacetylase/succinyl-diaminopimelate desuccinylase-like protein